METKEKKIHTKEESGSEKLKGTRNKIRGLL